MNRRQFIGSTLSAGLALATHAGADERKLRVAVIGHTGRGNYGHDVDKVWLTLPEVELVAVADADAKGLAAVQKRLKRAKGFTDYRAMLAETKPDIVAIAPRYVDEHRDMALAAIATGAHGIYCEKPFCRSPVEADEILAACEKNGVKLAVAHRDRYHPALAAVDKLLKAGAIGKLLEMRARGKEDARGGGLDLWVLGAHLMNLMHYFGGQPLACTATVLQGGKPATRADVQDGAEGVGPLAGNEVHARYEMERGVPAFFDSVQNAGDKAAGFGLQLIGTQGVIDFRVDKEPFAYLLPGRVFSHRHRRVRAGLVERRDEEARIRRVVLVGDGDLRRAARLPAAEGQPEHPGEQQRQDDVARELAAVAQQLLEVESRDAQDPPHARASARHTPKA